MNDAGVTLNDSAAMLRRDFDQSFALAPAGHIEPFDDFLAVQIAGVPHAIRLAESFGLHADCTIVPVPSVEPELLGIMAIHGILAPVYDLRVLLGYPGGTSPRWLTVARREKPVALAFDRFETYIRAPRSGVLEEALEHRNPLLRGGIRTGTHIRPVVHIASVLDTLTRRFGVLSETKRRRES